MDQQPNSRQRPLLCSQADACQMLAIGKTKLGELITNGDLESVRIGARHFVKIASVQRIAGLSAGEAEVA